MADDNKNSATEMLNKSANAASAIQGAVKTGKAVAGIAKGTAAGGPYGAAAAALWANRKLVGKIILAVLLILALPVLFILMLPSLIFGGLSDAFSPANQEVPILNDNTAIVENVNNISFSINSIMAEALDDVIERINRDFTSSGGDQIEINNPHEGNQYNNVNIFVSQYCSAKNKDFESINLADMERILRRGKSHLYSFTKREETRVYTTTDPETEEETEESELWIIYTITYNGESYFADTIFELDDDQKSLSKDYARNMSLFFGDGMFQGLLSTEFIIGPSYAGVTFTDGQTTVVYYNQLDERFANEPYGTDNIGGYGCGPTAMAIVISSLTNDTIDPIQMARWSYENDGWCSKSGSYHSLIPSAAKAWNLPVEGCTTAEPQRIVDALSSGKLVVAIMSKGHFTTSGHFIVLRGVTSSGTILVADPASYSRSEKEWDLSIILNEASRGAGSGGPFWIIG